MGSCALALAGDSPRAHRESPASARTAKSQERSTQRAWASHVGQPRLAGSSAHGVVCRCARGGSRASKGRNTIRVLVYLGRQRYELLVPAEADEQLAALCELVRVPVPPVRPGPLPPTLAPALSSEGAGATGGAERRRMMNNHLAIAGVGGGRAVTEKKQRRKRDKTRAGAIERWQEWQAHQYVGGYYTGGRVPPFYHGPRPNRFGWGLVAGGTLAAIAAVAAGLTATRPWSVGAVISVAVLGGVALLALAAGARLLSRRRG